MSTFEAEDTDDAWAELEDDVVTIYCMRGVAIVSFSLEVWRKLNRQVEYVAERNRK